MIKTELANQRNPESDRLFHCTEDAAAAYVRVRAQEVVGRSAFVNAVDRDVITIQLQSSIAKDDTGDVATDSDGAHLIMSASRLSIHLDRVVQLGGDVASVIEEAIRAEVEKAARKAWARAAVLPTLAKLFV